MSKKKKVEKEKKETPATVIPEDAQNKGDEQEPSPVTKEADALEPADDSIWNHPSLELLALAIESWKLSRFQSILYRLERAFAHQRKGEEYDIEGIFQELEYMNRGEHAQLIREMCTFSDTVLYDINARLAQKSLTK